VSSSLPLFCICSSNSKIEEKNSRKRRNWAAKMGRESENKKQLILINLERIEQNFKFKKCNFSGFF